MIRAFFSKLQRHKKAGTACWQSGCQAWKSDFCYHLKTNYIFWEASLKQMALYSIDLSSMIVIIPMVPGYLLETAIAFVSSHLQA